LWGYIDPTGKTVIEARYQFAWPFLNGVAAVRPPKNWQIFLLNPDGEVVVANSGFGTRRHAAPYSSVGIAATPEIFQVFDSRNPPNLTGYYSLTRNTWLWQAPK
jgi:hypothetical protein